MKWKLQMRSALTANQWEDCDGVEYRTRRRAQHMCARLNGSRPHVISYRVARAG